MAIEKSKPMQTMTSEQKIIFAARGCLFGTGNEFNLISNEDSKQIFKNLKERNEHLLCINE